MGALRFALLDPGSKAVLASQFTAGWAHSWFLYVLKADVALEEGEVLPASLRTLHSSIIYNELAVQIIYLLHCSKIASEKAWLIRKLFHIN